MNKTNGYSLLELLIGMSLGVLLMSMLCLIFMQLHQMNTVIDDRLFLENHFSFATQLLRSQIRAAGIVNHSNTILPSSEAIQIKADKNGNDIIRLNRQIQIQIKPASFPEGHAKYALVEGVEMVPGIDQLRAFLINNNEGHPVAVKLFMHITAPNGMTQSASFIVALQVYKS